MTKLWWFAFIKGYSTTAGLIIAIGAQNAFILRQGLIKSHVLIVALLASIIDISMIYLSLLNQLCKFSHKYLKFYPQILSKNEPWLHSNFGWA